MSQIQKLETIKEYRQERDQMFSRLADTEYQSPEHSEIMEQISLFDQNHDHLIDESIQAGGLVHTESFFSDLRRSVQHIPQDLGIDPHKIIDSIRGEFQHILQEMAAPIAKAAFKKSAEYTKKSYNRMKGFRDSHEDLVAAIDKLGVSVSLSVVTLHYNGFYRRAEGLTRLLSEQSEHFQFNRHSIRWIIRNTGPDSVDVNLSAELFSSAFSAGISFHGETELLVLLVDEALEHIGIPE